MTTATPLQRAVRLYTALLALVQSILPPSLTGQEASLEAGFVVKLTGQWEYVETGQMPTKLALGMSLRAGGQLRPQAMGSVVTIALVDGTTCTTSQATDGPAPPDLCPSPLRTSQKADSGVLARLLRAASVFFGSEESYVPALSRDSQNEPLSDAVVPLSTETLDLASVLEGTLGGTYRFLLQRRVSLRSPPGRRWKNAQEFKVIKGTGGSSVTPVSGLEVGLYRLVRLASESGGTTDQDAWILVASPDQYRAQEEAFREARRLAHGWQPKLGTERARGLLRAYLECLADASLRKP